MHRYPAVRLDEVSRLPGGVKEYGGDKIGNPPVRGSQGPEQLVADRAKERASKHICFLLSTAFFSCGQEALKHDGYQEHLQRKEGDIAEKINKDMV